MKYIFAFICATIILMIAGASTASAAVQLPANPRYAALGDSVAAGAGLPLSARSTAEDALCSRSPSAYPYQVAASLRTNVTLLVCSGAKVDEGLYGMQTRKGNLISAQIDQAFSVAKPDVMTITIGANDARWIEFMSKCYVATCGSRFDTAAAKVLRADLRIELSAALYRIKYLSGNAAPPKVLISGYYSPLATAECLGQGRITQTELSWIKAQTNSLNQAIRSVVPYFSYATYVPIDFTGHELCSADPWVQSISGVVPLHPTARGQSAIAQSFINVISK